MEKIIITIIIFYMLNMPDVFAKATANTNKTVLPPMNIFAPFQCCEVIEEK
jgi:hypothetical protein